MASAKGSFDGRWRSERFPGVNRVRGTKCIGSGGRSFDFTSAGASSQITIDGVQTKGTLSNDGTIIRWDDNDVWKIVPDLNVELNVPRGGKLGLRFVTPKLGPAAARPLRIQSIQADGAIARWNESVGRARGNMVRPGDEIVEAEVNGERGEPGKALKAGFGAMRLLVRQAPEQQVIEEIEFEEDRGDVAFKLHVDGRLDFHANGVLCLRGVKRVEVSSGQLQISGNATDESHAELFLLHGKHGAEISDLDWTFQKVRAMFDKGSAAPSTELITDQIVTVSELTGAARPGAVGRGQQARNPHAVRASQVEAHDDEDAMHTTWRFDTELGRTGRANQGFFDDIIKQLEGLPADQQGIAVLVEVEGEEEVRYASANSAVKSLRLKRGDVTY